MTTDPTSHIEDPSPKTLEPAQHHAFKILDSAYISEMDLKAVKYEHQKSATEIILFHTNAMEPERVFSIGFRTPVSDDTGVPHVIEHSVLCGSKHYPCKEPFAELLKGSLQTFLNAMTYPDRTVYPAASVNKQDFLNIMSVYLDAVFYPRAASDPLVLAQEGWQLQLKDPSLPLQRSGVVLSEMKGVFSSPDALLEKNAQTALYPDNDYRFVSGGDPKSIPTLTFDMFKKYHETYYKPHNCQMLVWHPKSDDAGAYLEFLDAFLKDFNVTEADRAQKIEAPAVQKKRLQPQKVTRPYPCAKGDVQDYVTLHYLLHEEPLSLYDELGLGALSVLLSGTPAAPMYRKLIQSGLGTQTVGSELCTELRQFTWSFGLKGVQPAPGKAEQISDLIISELKKLSEEGFGKDAVDAALNTVEFSLRERNTGRFPRGLAVLLVVAKYWEYGQDSIRPLMFEEPLQALKKAVASGEPVFQDLLKKYFVGNQHRVLVHLEGDDEMESRELKSEAEEMEALKATMTSDALDRVVSETQTLNAAQRAEDAPENLAKIPRLKLDDIPRARDELPSEIKTVAGATVISHDIASAGVLYADIGIDLASLSAAELPLLHLYSQLLTESGTSKMNETELIHHIGAHTGGLRVSPTVGSISGANNTVSDPNEGLGILFIQGKALSDKSDKLFNLISDIIVDVDLNNQRRASELVKETLSSKESSLVTGGHSFAALHVEAMYTVPDLINEQMRGIPYIEFLRKLQREVDEDWPSVLAKLNAIKQKLSVQSGRIINITGDSKALTAAWGEIPAFIERLPKPTSGNDSFLDKAFGDRKYAAPLWLKEGREMLKTLQKDRSDQSAYGFSVPTKVNYVAKAARLFLPGETIPPSFQVVSRAVHTSYIWDTVRVVGGAYGAYFGINVRTGIVYFFSARDPNLVSTLQAYDETGSHLLQMAKDMDTSSLEKYIIGSLTSEEKLRASFPDTKGYVALGRLLQAESPAQRQEERNAFFNTKPEDFRTMGEKLQTALHTPEGVGTDTKPNIAVVGSNDTFSGASSYADFKVVQVLAK